MKITYFYLANCPHCRNADRIIQEIVAEDSKYAGVTFEKIEESQNKALADSYDYWYVPCFYLGKQKLMEGVPTKEKIQAAMDMALQQ